MTGYLRLFNRQRTRPIDLRLLRRIILEMLVGPKQFESFDLTIHLLGARAMSAFNHKLLQHQGSTDVITLDYSAPGSLSLIGEVYVCVDEALAQAKRFRIKWQAELVRYVIHAVLHLEGYDDRKLGPRRIMKREENRRLRELARRFDLSKLARKPRLAR